MKQSMMLKLFMILLALAAIGGAVVLGFTRSAEVRGDTEVLDAGPETVVGEAVVRVEDTHMPVPPAAGETEDWRAYLLGLEAEDYATYTDAVQGFSFDYPQDFSLGTGVNDSPNIENAYVVVAHPDLPLAMQVRLWPLPLHDDIRDEVFSRLAQNEVVAPEGAAGSAVAWIEEDMPEPGRATGQFWFVRGTHLYQIMMMAPDLEWLQMWMRGFVRNDFMLTHPSQAL